MKRTIYLLLFLSVFACKDKECEQTVVQLQSEVEAYRTMSRGMLQVTAMLDSADADRNLLSEISRNDTLTRNTVLNRISGAMSLIENSKLKILELEDNLGQMGEENSGLKYMLTKFKQLVREKQDSLQTLNTRVSSLETENMALASAVWEREREIKQKNVIINQQKKDLVYTQNELLMREKEAILAEGEAARNAKMIEATKYFEKGLKEVALADKMSGLLKKKQKQSKYKEAYELFSKAYSLGKPEAKREMIKVQEKIKK